jgi:NDP-hexose-3-ketoreductase
MTGAPVRLGVLGCADIAVRRVLPAVASLPNISTVAVASRDVGRARAVTERFGGAAVEGYQRLLDRDDIDAVYLPLPSGLHVDWIRRAIHAGKHVLAEKPLTTSVADTVAVTAAAAEAGLVLRETYMFVHHSQHARVRDLVADGCVGDLRSFTATFALPARAPGDIRYRRELGGGALLDVGGYPLRAALHFLGERLELVGATARHDDGLGVDVGGAALVRRPDGVTGQLAFGMEHYYASRYELHGSAGRLVLEHVFTPPADHRPVVRLERDGRRDEIVLPPDDQCRNALAGFADAVLRGGPITDDTIVAQAKLVEACRAADPRWSEGMS